MQLSTNSHLLTKPRRFATLDAPHTLQKMKRQLKVKLRILLPKLKNAIYLWKERARQRRALAQLSNYQLKDIGLSRSDAINEAGKPFWKS
ncbi:DUF1127 domain-containing protein [Alkalimarinus coralli]|uniref:DUF1127 domain-containing protein n=1 Tax=Alkalimarinus coralli TaxID=2935863 RepID=UPI00202B215D|nr:DUF1127 domain-containing protein [Alkalimarinus coralli]